MSKYEKFNASTSEKVESSSSDFSRDLDEIARAGALRMLSEVLEAEVEEFLGRKRHERLGGDHGRGGKDIASIVQSAEQLQSAY